MRTVLQIVEELGDKRLIRAILDNIECSRPNQLPYGHLNLHRVNFRNGYVFERVPAALMPERELYFMLLDSPGIGPASAMRILLEAQKDFDGIPHQVGEPPGWCSTLKFNWLRTRSQEGR